MSENNLRPNLFMKEWVLWLNFGYSENAIKVLKVSKFSIFTILEFLSHIKSLILKIKQKPCCKNAKYLGCKDKLWLPT